jgi:hypothetical protein
MYQDQPDIAPPIPPVAPVHVQTNHVLHLLLSLCTCGAWLFVWPVIAMWNAYSNGRSRRLYEAARASYQQALWAHEQSQRATRARERQLEGRTLGQVYDKEGFRGGTTGDPLAGYRPAAGSYQHSQGGVTWTTPAPPPPASPVS